MPKYRLLTLEELESLHPEFIEFLIINGIAAEEWEAMKTKELGKAEKIIELFSDSVLETVLRKINFIEQRGKNYVYVFQCLAESQVVVGMEVPDSLRIDFRDTQSVQQAMNQSVHGAHVFTSTKPYSRSREEELFDLLQSGGVITDNRLFNALCLTL